MLEKRLEELEHNRFVMRSQRDKSGLVKIALVGYTNAGKSTLLNRLTDADVLCEDKLFATLDPTTRKMELPSGVNVLFTDTVGFIRKLPHHLIKAFKSTLDEVRFADILLIVSDANDPEVDEHLVVTNEIIKELDSYDKPAIYVYNKCDSAADNEVGRVNETSVRISAKEGSGIDALLLMIEEIVARSKKKVSLLIPYCEQGVVNMLYNIYNVESVEYAENGINIEAVLDSKGLGKFAKYIVGGA
jgi:GTP-binding protein HflX